MGHNKLHIVHAIFRFDTGGLENGVVNLINCLPADMYHHSIVTLNGRSEEFAQRVISSNVEYYDIGKRAGKDFGAYKRVYTLLKKLNPDVLHTRNLATLECQLPGWLCSVPYRVHGEHGWDIFDVGGTNKKYQWLRRPFRYLVDQYIALSSESADYLRNKIGVKVKRIAHICNGVDMKRFQTEQNIDGEEPAGFFNNNSIVFGTVGRLAEVKNQGLLVDAFIALAKLNNNIKHKLRLVIVGDGVLMPSLKEKVHAAGLSENVWLAGNRSDVAAFLQKMHIFVLPSLAEGISNTFLEAMASGLVVIATKVGGNVDLIYDKHRETHLVDVTDVEKLTRTMHYYVQNPEKIDSDGREVLRHCQQNFSLEIMVEKYHRIYQQAVEKK